MVDLEFATKILGIVYENWFKDTVTGVSEETMAEKLKADKNEVSKATKALEINFLIEHDTMYWWKITSFGIDSYEEQLPVSEVSKRTSQRRLILEALKEVYDQDTEKELSNEDLKTKTGISDFFELDGQVKYLKDKGLIELNSFLGQSFLARLTGAGAVSLEQQEYDGVKPMTSAYSILFSLENHLRRFIEKKVTREIRI